MTRPPRSKADNTGRKRRPASSGSAPEKCSPSEGGVIMVQEADMARTHTRGVLAAPIGPRGMLLRWELREPGRRAYADSADDILGLLIAGYPGGGDAALDEETRLQLRTRHAAGVRRQLAALPATVPTRRDSIETSPSRSSSSSEGAPTRVHDLPSATAAGGRLPLFPETADRYLRSLATAGWCVIAEAV